MFSTSAQARVIASTRELFEVFVDGKIETPRSTIELKRIYHSGNRRVGLFGRGWCASWEDRLQISHEGVNLIACGARTSIPFEKKGAISFSPLGHRLTQTAGQYLLFTPSSDLLQTFDGQGRLLSVADRDGSGYSVQYRDETLTGLKFIGVKDPVEFVQTKGRITEMRWGKQKGAAYAYKNETFLSQVRNFWKNEYTLETNQVGDLVKIKFPDGTAQAMTYDTQRHVTVLTDRFGCQEKIQSAKDKTTATKTCAGKVVASRTFNGKPDLRRRDDLGRTVRADLPGATVDFSYSEDGYRPIRARVQTAQRTSVYKYKYDHQGRVSEITLETGENLRAKYGADSDLLSVESAMNRRPSNAAGESLRPLLEWNRAVSLLEDQ